MAVYPMMTVEQVSILVKDFENKTRSELLRTEMTEEPVGICWDCIKGRHGICIGRDDDPPAGTGGRCICIHEEHEDEDYEEE